MFSELSHEQRNSYAYQRNVLPHFSLFSSVEEVKQLSVTGADRSKFFSNPMGNVRTINVGLMADESIDSLEETQIIKYRTTSIQTTFRYFRLIDWIKQTRLSPALLLSPKGILRTNKAMATRNNMLRRRQRRR
jgi:hypothetical protein